MWAPLCLSPIFSKFHLQLEQLETVQMQVSPYAALAAVPTWCWCFWTRVSLWVAKFSDLCISACHACVHGEDTVWVPSTYLDSGYTTNKVWEVKICSYCFLIEVEQHGVFWILDFFFRGKKEPSMIKFHEFVCLKYIFWECMLAFSHPCCASRILPWRKQFHHQTEKKFLPGK